MSKTKELIETIRAALDDEAGDLTRRRARDACEQLLAVASLEPGEPLPIQPSPQALAVPVVPTPVSPAVAYSPASQMLDVSAPARVRSSLVGASGIRP
jgi:hypothetical protein